MIFEQAIVFSSGLIAMLFASFSGGGALLTVPVLLFVGLAPAVAVATNRLMIFFQALARQPMLNGKLNLGFKVPALLITVQAIGAAIGAVVLISIDPELLFQLLGATLIAGAILTYYSGNGIKPVERKNISKKAIAFSSIGMFAVGIYRGFFGPAAGVFDRLVSIQILGLDYVQSMAFANYTGIFSSLTALAIFLNHGIVDFSYGIPLIIGGVIGAVFGTKFALEQGNEFIKYVFIAISLLFGGYFLLFR